MISMSVAFHIGSAACIVYVATILIKTRKRLSFIQSISNGNQHKIFAAQPIEAVKAFCAAFNIPYQGQSLPNKDLARVKLSHLALLHVKYGISHATLSADKKPTLNFHLSKNSDTIDQDQKQIESDLSGHVSVIITSR